MRDTNLLPQLLPYCCGVSPVSFCWEAGRGTLFRSCRTEPSFVYDGLRDTASAICCGHTLKPAVDKLCSTMWSTLMHSVGAYFVRLSSTLTLWLLTDVDVVPDVGGLRAWADVIALPETLRREVETLPISPPFHPL